jgi:hypothetical protein
MALAQHHQQAEHADSVDLLETVEGRRDGKGQGAEREVGTAGNQGALEKAREI